VTFAADTTAIFAGPLGADATYTPAGGAPVAVRVIPRQADAETGWQEMRIVLPTTIFLVPVAALAAAPVTGDTIAYGGSTYAVQGAPVRDERRLRWTVEARPA